MPDSFRLRSPQRLLMLFLAATLLPSAALVWLGWQFVEQDRRLEDQRVRDVLERAAGTIATSLEKELTAIERGLAARLDADEAAVPTDGAIAVRFAGAQVVERAGAPLVYVPVSVAPFAEPDDARWTDGERLEFTRRDFSAAARAYRAAAASSDPHVSAGSLVRLARALRRTERPDDALDVYDRMARLAEVRVNGDPADLLARWARVELLAQLQRADEAQREGASLAEDLHGGRWAIDRTTYLSYAGLLAPWTPRHGTPSTVLTEAISLTWHAWQRGPSPDTTNTSRQVVRVADTPVLVLQRTEPDGLVVFAATPEYIARSWAHLWSGHGLDAALLDDEGRAVIGAVSLSGTSPVFSVSAAETRLPWTVRVTATSIPPEVAGAGQARRRIMIAGLAVLAILLPASAYLVGRAVQREMAAARQQANFVSAVSHEFRSPLTSLVHLTSLLRGEFEPGETRRRQYYDALAHEAERLRRFVDTLLDFGRMQAGAAQCRVAPASVAPLIQTLVDEFRKDLSAGGHDVTCTIAETLPAVLVDPDALTRAVWNLLENAAKYSPADGAIVVRVEMDAAAVAIRVSDRGVGIPSEEQPHVFRQFYRGAAALDSAIKGTGVGLAVVDHIVRSHGGEVRLDSAPGAGSTFSILLPAVDDAAADRARRVS